MIGEAEVEPPQHIYCKSHPLGMDDGPHEVPGNDKTPSPHVVNHQSVKIYLIVGELLISPAKRTTPSFGHCTFSLPIRAAKKACKEIVYRSALANHASA